MTDRKTPKTTPRISPRAAAIALLTCTLALPALADQVTLNDGKTLTGDISAEDATSLTIRIGDSTSTLTLSRRVAKSNIKSIARTVREGPPYVQIPVHGEIGVDVTIASIDAGLSEAAKASPKFIVLDIDSPGGNIGELITILDLVAAAQKDRPVVAYVHNAYSAAAVLAMSCRDIYIEPHGVIGAAVPYLQTKFGPADVDAKMRSAIAAKQRTYVTAAGHDPLLLQGMMEMDIELFLADTPPVLRTYGPGKTLKRKNEILTLTATEAAACGLARISPTLLDLGKQLTGGAWHESTHRPWDAANATAAGQQREKRQQAESGQRATKTRAAFTRARPELDALQNRIDDLTAKIAKNAKALVDLRKKCDADVAQIKADYDQAKANARTQADLARAKDNRDNRLDAVRDNYDTNSTRYRADGTAALTEATQLRARQKQLLATLPQD